MRRFIARLVLLFSVTSCGGAAPDALPPSPAGGAAAPPRGRLPAPPASENGRLPKTVRPRRYALDLDIDPSKERFSGRVRIEVDVLQPTSYVILHGRDVSATRAAATSAGALAAQHAGRVIATRSSEAGGPKDELVLAFDPPLGVGPATVDLVYEAPFTQGLDGLYRARDRGRDYAFTQFEPTDARRAFPCFDEPAHKTPFAMTVRVPRGMIAVANSPEAKRVEEADGVRFTFAPTAPIPTYLVAFAVGDFDIVEGRKTPFPIRVITTKGRSASARAVLEPAAEIVDAIARYLDVPYPYAKLDLVSVPEFGPGAMENPGLVTFREELLLLDPSRPSPAATRARDSVVAHELAHQWFGDLVTMEWWDDLWLNESFATWMTDHVLAEIRPNYRTSIGAVQSGLGVMDFDALPSAQPVHRPVASASQAMEAFDGITYQKGAAVIRMFEKAATPERFRAGLKSYLQAHAFGSARTEDLVAALSKSAQQPLESIAKAFLEQSGVPAVSVERDCRKDGASLILSQYPWSPIGASPPAQPLKQWTIPLCVREEGREPTCFTMNERRHELPLPRGCGGWLYPNASQGSYVRLSFPPAELTKLTRSLGKLDAKERLGMLASAWAATRAGELPVATLLDTLNAFDGEKEREIVEQSIEVLWGIGALLTSDEDRARLREFVRARLVARKRALGWGTADSQLGRPAATASPRTTARDAAAAAGAAGAATAEEAHLLRRSVLFAMGELGRDDQTLEEADVLARVWLQNPKRLDPETGALALELASRRGDASRLAELIAASKKAEEPADRIAALRAMGGFDDANVVTQALDFAFGGEVNLKDIRYVVEGALRNGRSRDVVLAWMMSNWERATQRVKGPGQRRLVGVVFGLCERKTVEAARAFYKARPVEGGARLLDQALEQASRCAALAEGLRPQLVKAMPAARARAKNAGARPE